MRAHGQNTLILNNAAALPSLATSISGPVKLTPVAVLWIWTHPSGSVTSNQVAVLVPATLSRSTFSTSSLACSLNVPTGVLVAVILTVQRALLIASKLTAALVLLALVAALSTIFQGF